MNIREEKDEKASIKRVLKMLFFLVVVTMCVIIGVVGYMMYIEESQLKVRLDGTLTDVITSDIVFKDDGSVYLPLRKIAEVYGYQTYNGEYSNKSEDTGKCYIDSSICSVDFEVNSKEIYRVTHNSTYNKYEYDMLSYPIEFINNQFYVNSVDLEKAMYVTFSYDISNNVIDMLSLSYYVNLYETKALEYGFTEFDLKHENTVALFDDILIAKKSGKVGAINLKNGETILEAKYDDITYLVSSGEFLVKSSGQYGIMTADKRTRIEIEYDSIEILDNDLGLYVVKKGTRYGILDNNGQTKVYPEYEQIGVDLLQFSENDVENKYLIGNNLIPLKKDGLWGLLDLDFKAVTDFQFDSLGYITKVSSSDKINLLVIKDYNVVVAEKDGKYTLVGPDGTLLYPIVLDDIYMTTKNGYEQFYIIYGTDEYDVKTEMQIKGLQATSGDGITGELEE